MSTTKEKPSPENQYRCEARVPGSKPFEFDTPTGETARAMCDAHGWEFIRVYEPGKDADRPAGRAEKGDPPLSPRQIRALATEASRAYRIHLNAGLVDTDEDTWRREQVKLTVKRDGLSKCQNSHYKKLMRHFMRMGGKKTVDAEPHAGGSQSAEGGDTFERREQVIRQIAQELGEHARRVQKPDGELEQKWSKHAEEKGGIIGIQYLMTVARRKNPGATITDEGCLVTLTAAKLEHLLTTMRNRIAAREGRGKPENRNKGQRKKKGQ